MSYPWQNSYKRFIVICTGDLNIFLQWYFFLNAVYGIGRAAWLEWGARWFRSIAKSHLLCLCKTLFTIVSTVVLFLIKLVWTYLDTLEYVVHYCFYFLFWNLFGQLVGESFEIPIQWRHDSDWGSWTGTWDSTFKKWQKKNKSKDSWFLGKLQFFFYRNLSML